MSEVSAKATEILDLLKSLKQDCNDHPGELHLKCGKGHAVCAAVGERTGAHLIGRLLEWRIIVQAASGWRIEIRQYTLEAAMTAASFAVLEHEEAN